MDETALPKGRKVRRRARRCPRCRADLPDANVRRNGPRAEAECAACFFRWTFDASAIGHVDPGDQEDAPPPGVSMTETDAGLVLVRRWLSVRRVVLTVAGICGVATAGHLFALTSDGSVVGVTTLAVFLMIPMLLVSYAGLIGFTNRTRIHVDGEALSVVHGPFPMFGTKDWRVPRGDVEQLFVQTVSHRGARGGSQLEHRLCAALADGRRITLVPGVERIAQALFLERKLEAHLGITDDPQHDRFIDRDTI